MTRLLETSFYLRLHGKPTQAHPQKGANLCLRTLTTITTVFIKPTTQWLYTEVRVKGMDIQGAEVFPLIGGLCCVGFMKQIGVTADVRRQRPK
jgi:hypothetical protein